MNTFSIFSTNFRKKLAQLGVGSSVGEVKHSMLTEDEFQTLHGTQWVLMDGRNVSGSDYHTLKSAVTIPDARGQFLRGKNNGRDDGYQDEGGERSVGNHQQDSTKRPNTNLTGNAASAGAHTHSLTVATSPAPYNANFAGGSTSGTSSRATGSGGAHTHGVSIIGGGDAETRPRNIAVNYFIKINW